MAHIKFTDVCLNFPVYDASARSLRNMILNRSHVGGTVESDGQRISYVRALENINLEINRGDVVGLIGHNGSGKSTLLRTMSGIYYPTHGTINTKGSITSIIDFGMGLNPELTGEENINLICTTVLEMGKKEIDHVKNRIIEFAELDNFITMPIRTYSSGMRLRLAFGILTCNMPEILILDEIIGVGDNEFFKKAKARMLEIIQHSSIVVIASHDQNILKEVCNKYLALDHGKIKYFGESLDTAYSL